MLKRFRPPIHSNSARARAQPIRLQRTTEERPLWVANGTQVALMEGRYCRPGSSAQPDRSRVPGAPASERRNNSPQAKEVPKMAIVRWNPTREMSRFDDEFNRVFRNFWNRG